MVDSTRSPASAPAPAADRGLKGNRDFLKLWAGESLALVGSEVTLVALPLVAVTLLGATPTQMGLLGAAMRAPTLLYLVVGVWLDRVRRRPVMVGSDLGRFILLATIPLLYAVDVLTFGWLCLVAAGVGAMGVMFDVAYQAYLPSLVGREQLGEANGKLSISQSLAQVGGPSLAAAMLARFSAASTLAFGAVACLVSAVNLAAIRRPEPRPEHEDEERARLLPMIRDGLRYVVGQRILRTMVLATGVFMTFFSGLQALYILFLVKDLGISSGLVGLIFAVGGGGAIIGASLSVPVLRRFGPGRTAIWCTVACNPAFLLIPFATDPTWLTIGMLVTAQFVTGLTMPMAGVSMGSVRQALTPTNMQGRVASAFRGLTLSIAPLGALAAGVGADLWGTRPVLLVCGIGLLVPIFIYWFSPIPGLRTLPSLPD
jgi:MFS family permease